MQRSHQIRRDLAGRLNPSRGGGDDRGQRPGVGDAVELGPGRPYSLPALVIMILSDPSFLLGPPGAVHWA